MNSTNNYLLDKFTREKDRAKMPIEIPDFGRDQLASLFSELGFTSGAEIGVEQGEYSEVLLSKNPKLFLYLIDSWKAYRGYRDHTRQEKLDKFYQTTQQRLNPYLNRIKIFKGFSMDVVEGFNDNSLDFVYIDANHDFLHVAEDIHYWSKKVRPGGIVAGHDYVKRKNEAAHVHVRQVLNGYTDAYNIRPWFVLGREEKVEGEIRDMPRSWMFVKE